MEVKDSSSSAYKKLHAEAKVRRVRHRVLGLTPMNLHTFQCALWQGAIHASTSAASNDASLVIKKIYDTQRDSADAEYEIAALLATDGGDRWASLRDV